MKQGRLTFTWRSVDSCPMGLPDLARATARRRNSAVCAIGMMIFPSDRLDSHTPSPQKGFHVIWIGSRVPVNCSQGDRVKGEEGQPAEPRAKATAAEPGCRHQRSELPG